MAGAKWTDDSHFTEGGELRIGDKVMGLRTSLNYKFDFPSDGIKDADANYLIKWATTGAGATNYISFSNGESGTPTKIDVTGSDANVDLDLDLKGSGLLTINSSTGVDGVLDEDAMGSDSAVKLATQQSIKAYVDNSIAAGAGGSNTQIQYNNAGGFGGDTGFITDGSGSIDITGDLDVDNINLNGNILSSTDTNGNIVLDPDGSGEIQLGAAVVTVEQYIQHSGDANNQIEFGTDTQDYQTGGSSRLDISDSGVRLGGANSRVTTVLDEDAMGSDSPTALATQQSIKAYVDSSTPTGAALTRVSDTNVTLTLGGTPSTALLQASSITAGWAGQLSLARGGSNASLTADDGGIIYSDASAMAVLAATATAGQMIRSGSNTAPTWSTATFASTYGASTLLYSNGANTVTGLATANSAMLVTDSSGVPAWTSSLTNGQVIIGSTGATPVPATLSSGAGISIAVGAGTITISGTGSGIGWTEVTGTSQAMAADTGYIANNAGLVTLTLPVTAALGTVSNVVGKGGGGWAIAQNAGQTIHFGNVDTTTGAGGSLASSNQYDSISLLCTVANTDWTVFPAPQGNITIV